MAAQFYSMKISDSGGVTAYTALVQDTANGAGYCKHPAAANAPGFVGIATDDQLKQNQAVPIQMTEDVIAIASGAIAVGDYVNIANASGQLQSCQATVAAAPGTVSVLYVVGQALEAAAVAGDFFRVQLRPHVVKTAAS